MLATLTPKGVAWVIVLKPNGKKPVLLRCQKVAAGLAIVGAGLVALATEVAGLVVLATGVAGLVAEATGDLADAPEDIVGVALIARFLLARFVVAIEPIPGNCC